MASACRVLGSVITFGLVSAGVLAGAATDAQAAAPTVLWAAPDGHGAACTAKTPCSLDAAQTAVRRVERGRKPAGATVELLDGTYRLAKTWKFGTADSGTPGHPVVWRAAPGAHPVVSGATRVTGWSQVGGTGVWSAKVPRDSASRQLYVDGAEAPVAQATPAALGFAGGWTGSATGYDLSKDPAALAWFAALTPAQVAQVEFDYPGGSGPWTDSKCGVASMSGSELVMDQPCWNDATNGAPFTQGSGGLPSMSPSQMPTTVRNARGLLGSGQWFLDSAQDRIYYAPKSGQRMSAADVELPRLETLLRGAGSLTKPVHDITFTGLQFSYATWNDPSTSVGFADVQSNLRRTQANNQGLCTFSTPAGSCPWGALTQPLANVDFTGADSVTLSGNEFADLGGAGLSFKYGGSHNVIEGNEFTQIASTAISLGCTYDPTPTTTSASVIKDNCTPDPKKVAADRIGENEILDHTTVADNVIHAVGTDYPSACGITLLFSRHTTITHNDLYDLPYTGITAGVIEGHVDEADHPQNSTNINADNTISDNLIHDVMKVLDDGGAIYIEGHQAGYVDNADGTLDSAATLANGLHITGNVVYNDGSLYNAYYDDAGSEWIDFSGNVEFHPLTPLAAQGGCSSTGHFWVTGNYFSDRVGSYDCNPPVDSNISGNTVIPASPGPNDIPESILAGAGPTGAYQSLTGGLRPEADYLSAPTPVAAGSTTEQVFIAGSGFTPTTPVFFGDQRATSVRWVSHGFLVATVPAGADAADVTVGAYVPRPQITSPTVGTVGLADTFTVRGTGAAGDTVAATDETGNAGCTATVDRTGGWTCAFAGAAEGRHTLTATQSTKDGSAASKPSSGVAVYVGTPPAAARIDDTDASVTYSNWSYSAGRGYGDYNNDIHYTTANGASLTSTFMGTGVKVFGEEYTDQGDISVSIDQGTPVIVSTVPADGARHADAVVYTSPTLASGVHTITVAKVSGSYATFDGLEIDNPVAG
ncbi:right-handed parallel beta-helix repeat-containing protein [Actinacidiphila yeochonensis]|uniref:right-handed parallel beta-helix repeat-containing protein n=1 Tax=Actinacidiphila yeochonensis TaxID=89050 RepID=UPI0012FE8B0E|nr:right-handed parallel beta-helix repeat-containing protein [Actinacidiphila yeochonensis]